MIRNRAEQKKNSLIKIIFICWMKKEFCLYCKLLQLFSRFFDCRRNDADPATPVLGRQSSSAFDRLLWASAARWQTPNAEICWVTLSSSGFEFPALFVPVEDEVGARGAPTVICYTTQDWISPEWLRSFGCFVFRRRDLAVSRNFEQARSTFRIVQVIVIVAVVAETFVARMVEQITVGIFSDGRGARKCLLSEYIFNYLFLKRNERQNRQNQNQWRYVTQYSEIAAREEKGKESIISL